MSTLNRSYKKPLSQLEQYFYIDKLIVLSIDLSLYQVAVLIDGEEFLICDDNGTLLRAHCIVDIQKLCRNLTVNQQVLRQNTAYDEMIGGPVKGDDLLEVPLADNQLY